MMKKIGRIVCALMLILIMAGSLTVHADINALRGASALPAASVSVDEDGAVILTAQEVRESVSRSELPQNSKEQITKDKTYSLENQAYNSDGVRLILEAKETDTENYFDITYTAEIKELSEKKNIDVIFVIDKSLSMNTSTDGEIHLDDEVTTRLDQTKNSIIDFIKGYCTDTQTGDKRLGIITYDANVYRTMELEKTLPDTEYIGKITEKINGIKSASDDIKSLGFSPDKYIDESIIDLSGVINPYGNNEEEAKRAAGYSNLEGALEMASEMFAKDDSFGTADGSGTQRYVVLITDSLPTTYLNKDVSLDPEGEKYFGYDPVMPDSEIDPDRLGQDGYFANGEASVVCSEKVNYSDKAAEKAKESAKFLKEKGVSLFVMGEETDDILMEKYLNEEEDTLDIVSYRYDDDMNRMLEIGAADRSDAYSNFLKSTIGGSGTNGPVLNSTYADADNYAAMGNALGALFGEMKRNGENIARALSLTGDVNEYLEIVNFFDMNGNSAPSLSGNAGENQENTAKLENGKLEWTLYDEEQKKGSGYKIISGDSLDVYRYELKFRVRLRNEAKDFESEKDYPVFGSSVDEEAANIKYSVTDGDGAAKECILGLAAPTVKGYLIDLDAMVYSALSKKIPVQGAKFILSHAEDCPLCVNGAGDEDSLKDQNKDFPGEESDAGDNTMILATSDEQGAFIIANIPSGHRYLLREELEDQPYIAMDERHPEAAYGSLFTDDGENALEETYEIENLPLNQKIYTVNEPALTDVAEGETADKDISMSQENIVSLGEKIGYTLIWSNDKDEKQQIVLYDKLSRGLEYVKGSADIEPDSVTINQATGETLLKWKIGEQEADSAGKISYEAMVIRTAIIKGTVTNNYKIQYGTGTKNEVNSLSNYVNSAKAYMDGSMSESVKISSGNVIGYALSWINPTDEEKEITLFDTLSRGLAYKEGSASTAPTSIIKNADGSTTLEWRLGVRQPKEKAYITYKAVADKNLSGITSVNNLFNIKYGDSEPVLAGKLINKVGVSETTVRPSSTTLMTGYSKGPGSYAVYMVISLVCIAASLLLMKKYGVMISFIRRH